MNDLRKKSKIKYCTKYKNLKEQFKEKFGEAAAPEQKQDFMMEILILIDDNSGPEELQKLLSKYQSKNNYAMEKLMISSLTDHKKYTSNYKVISLVVQKTI